jgi:ketosteroid isomerase-like protein
VTLGPGWLSRGSCHTERKAREKESKVPSHDETIEQVKRANERFYRAFESLDSARMAAMWVQAERAKCVHPGWSLLSGWEAIRQSWEAIFANTEYMRFVITEVVVHLYGNVAWVTCMENLSDAPDTLQMAHILATNVYEQTTDGWRIVHHHASPVLRPAPTMGDVDPEFLN